MNAVPPPVETPAPAPAPPAVRNGRYRDIYVQALFTLVAVVLAFAVEEWREERGLDRIVDEARQAIVEEIRHNREELLESRRDTVATIEALDAGADGTALRSFSFELALLSSAAWRSAQSMDVTRRIDQPWMLQVARAHELQAMYEQAQWSAVEANMALKASADDAVLRANALALRAHMRQLDAFSRALESDYDGLLPPAK